MTTTAGTSSVDPNALLFEILMTPEGKADPYPRYAALHEHAPVFESAMGGLVVTRYDDCSAVLRDGRFGKFEGDIGPNEGRLTEHQRERMNADSRVRGRSMLFLNPPDHTRLRGLVSKAFTPRTVEALRPHIARLTDELLDGFAEQEDVMSALAFPLPATVIGEMLGVPEGDRPMFQPLVRAATKSLDFTMTDDEFDAAMAASDTMNAYFEGLVAERRKAPQGDLLSALIAARDERDRLTEDEIIATAILLFAAGFETTTNLIGNGLFALLRNPDQLQRLRDDPGLLRPGVEELLRWDSPVQIDGRLALEAAEVAGRDVPKDTFVITMISAGNHDPTHYTEPGRLDVGRDEGPCISFAAGIHYCLGAALARLEGQVVLDRLLSHFSSMELADHGPAYRDSFTLRGLVDLPVAFTRA
ncbi:cytochrome P450 [soil metagenome]